jgi:hypothetical protein
MKSKIKIHAPRISFLSALLLALLLLAPLSIRLAMAQAANRFLGTVTSITGSTLTVKTDAGEVKLVDVPASAALKRIAPGQKDLSAADTIQLTDLETGDRVLVKLDPDAPGPNGQALQIVAVKAADVAAKQQKEREDWQRRGVGGLVKSVDAAGGVVQLTSGVGAAAKTITVHTTKTTMLKRYAPASVRFDTAQPAPIDAIHVGDQLRARGTKSADGLQIDAEEVISGSFRNLSGTIASLDAAGSTFAIKDLATKKQLTIHITPDAQMRRLPDMMARMMAARLKGGTAGAGGDRQGAGGVPTGQRAGGGQGFTQGGGSGWSGGGGGGDPQQMLNRAPVIQFADLKKGDAVMIVSSDGATDVTAITLLAGVEPLLEAPAASQSLLSNWSMGSGGAEAAAQ